MAEARGGRKRSGRGCCVSGETKPAACGGETKRTETDGTSPFSPVRECLAGEPRGRRGRDATGAGLSPRGPAPPAAALSPGGSRRLSLGDARSSGGSVTGAITRGGVSTSPPGRPLFGSRTFPWRRPKSQPIPAPGRHVQGRGTACWTLTRPTLRPARGPPAGSTRHARPPRARRAAAPAGEVASGVVRPCGRPP